MKLYSNSNSTSSYLCENSKLSGHQHKVHFDITMEFWGSNFKTSFTNKIRACKVCVLRQLNHSTSICNLNFLFSLSKANLSLSSLSHLLHSCVFSACNLSILRTLKDAERWVQSMLRLNPLMPKGSPFDE